MKAYTQKNVIKLTRYLKETMNNKLFYLKTSTEKQLKFKLTEYTDVVYTDCIITRKFTARYLFCINSLLVI